MSKLDKNIVPDKKTAAVCGLFCPACSAYIGTTEDPARLQMLSARLGRRADELACNGCRSDKLSFFCKEMCVMKPCAEKKGVDFCSECDEYPCEALRKFQAAAPHRIELWRSLKMIKEQGYEPWFRSMALHYACPKCGVLNSAYDLVCRSCGASPSSEYTLLHKSAIALHLYRK